MDFLENKNVSWEKHSLTLNPDQVDHWIIFILFDLSYDIHQLYRIVLDKEFSEKSYQAFDRKVLWGAGKYLGFEI